MIKSEDLANVDGGGMRKSRSLDFGSVGAGNGDCVWQAKVHNFVRSASSEFDNALISGCERMYAPGKKEAPLSCAAQREGTSTGCSIQRSSSNTSLQGGRPEPLRIRLPIGNWTFGKSLGSISVLILLLGTAADFCLCQVQRLESPDMYDALSAEVIRPAFRYQTNARKRPSLGSAAISSVTSALSPILPFAGGLDLRREEYWATPGNWLQRLQSVATQVQEAFSQQEPEAGALSDLPRGGGTGKAASQSTVKRKAVSRLSSISAQQPFVPLESIADMTLGDVASTLQYAVECNKVGFNEAKFLSGLVPRAKKVITAMQSAMAKSRGKDAKLSSASTPTGAVDALAFCGAMRIFGEWRVVRQVPPGYKGYAVGMSLGHKDIVQNVAKIEQTVHDWLDLKAASVDENQTASEVRSPTLRQLLEFEIESDINPTSRLPRLAEKSGAMGLLWVRRQLHYQTLIFNNVLKIPSIFPTTTDAVTAAYKEVYDKLHGWAVQKIFQYSFKSAPEAEVIYRHMNPHLMKEVTVSASKMRFEESASEEERSKDNSNDHPVVGFFKHIGSEWDKLACSVGRLLDQKNEDSPQYVVRGGSQEDDDAMQDFITQTMMKDAHQHISEYLEVVHPLLDDLAELFNQLNMDDPTRV